MKRLASSLLVSTGLLVLILTFSASNTQAVSAPRMSSTAEPGETTAVEDHVVLERRFDRPEDHVRQTRRLLPIESSLTARGHPSRYPRERPSCSPTSRGRSPKKQVRRGLSARSGF